MSAAAHPNRLDWQRLALWSVLLLFAAVFLLPMYVMLTTSLKDMEQIRNGNLLSLPTAPTLAAWSKAWSHACTTASLQARSLSASLRQERRGKRANTSSEGGAWGSAWRCLATGCSEGRGLAWWAW